MNGLNEGIRSTDGMTLIGKQIRYTRRKPVLTVTPSTTYPKKTGLWSKPDVRGDRPTFTRLMHGAARNAVSPGTKTVFSEGSSEMHAAVGRTNICWCQHKTHKLHPQNALKFRNYPIVPNFSHSITNIACSFSSLLSCICKLNFHLRPRGIKMEQQTPYRSPGGQIIPFPFPYKTLKKKKLINASDEHKK
jgi:hypothetical protein